MYVRTEYAGLSASMACAKRVFDLMFVLAAAPAALVLVGIAALAIRLSYGRPIFFLQERVGREGRVFWMIKLRTMTCSSVPQHPAATARGDRRITPLGKVLREYRIDELPQLI